MSLAEWIKVNPATAEAIYKAYDYGQISFETMRELLGELKLSKEISKTAA